jgi:hypothetical protein
LADSTNSDSLWILGWFARMIGGSDLDAGVDYPFGQLTGYELVHEEKRYPPKAVIETLELKLWE